MAQKVDKKRQPLTRKKGKKSKANKEQVGSACTWGPSELKRFKVELDTQDCPSDEMVNRDCFEAKRASDESFRNGRA
jgi:hypothetical protein